MLIPEIGLMGLAFVIKHFLAEFLYQRPYNWLNKGTYGHMGGISHTLNHALMSFFILLFEAPLLGLFGLIIAEAVIRYHVEWFKMKIVKKTGFNHIDHAPEWWILTGVQQSVYYAVYVVMICLVVDSDGSAVIERLFP